MDTNTLPQTTVNARSLLLPYTLGLVAAMLLIQATIALTGGDIGLLAGALTAVVALATATWMWRNARKLYRIRFGFAVAHAIAFTAVTTSFNLHAVIRVFNGDAVAAAPELLATPWFGATLLMSAAWGLGLLIHLTGTVLGRGWED